MKNTSVAFIPSYFNFQENLGSSLLKKTGIVLGGTIILTLLAQISIPLPFTPVPITGQTFGVSLIALLFGARLGVMTVLTYLTAGFLGVPVFASFKTLALLSPTTGYLLGMLLSSYVVGSLADKGSTRSFKKTLGSCLLGSICIFTVGVSWLYFFFQKEALFLIGVLPFLPGDAIKSVLASAIAVKTTKEALAEENVKKIASNGSKRN